MSLEAIGAEHIRATYAKVFGEVRLGWPGPGGADDRAHLAGTLRGQLQALLEELAGREFRGEIRATADHVTGRTREALAVDEAAAAGDPEQLHDMAVLARSLLELCRLPTLPPPGAHTPLPHCIP
ncbi:hypothetical protein [Streptomyces sp. NPDC056628]|uniref:hypothetical protein n=1 Tax=Streptomyces sp. NPDC056628 TaxID=3345882 RepID=UPI0036983B8A